VDTWSDGERTAFEARGVVRLRAAAEPEAVRALREAVRARIGASKPTPRPSQLAKLVQPYGFAKTWGPRVAAALDALLGAGRWRVPACAGQVLFVNPPEPDAAWDVPRTVWHLDFAAPGAARVLPGVQIFACLDRVAPRGGGTVVIAGSHAAIDALRRRAGDDFAGRSREVRQALLRESAWLRDLCTRRAGEDRGARFMAEPRAGESLQVVELTGEPGDVWLMHPWTLHAPAPSCGDRPRMVLCERVHALGP
jgi:phytanoyl-CoA dioxygenase PhyH